MKINEVNLLGKLFDDGLGDIKMPRLGEVVILAGANGAGKSRLLRRIETAVNHYKNQDIVSEKEKDSTLFKNQLENKNTLIETQIDNYHNGIKQREEDLKYQKSLVFDGDFKEYQAINFVPIDLTYDDPKRMSTERVDEIYTQSSISNSLSGQTTYAYIAKVARDNNDATHQNTAETAETKQHIEEYQKLNSLIQSFLGTDLDYYGGEAKLFGLTLSKAELSEGQKVLLQLCVAIHTQGAKLENLILILDEPENHLHPKALVDYVLAVKDTLKKGQLWIATHSIHLLSIFDTSSIWYVNENEIEYAGRSPEIVLAGLIGDEEHTQKLKDFINLPAEYALNQFALECLGAPTVAATGENDPQVNQIKEILSNIHASEKKPLRILDYGAGKGRLLDGLFYEYQKSDENISEKIDYFAYDKIDTDKDKCTSVIKSVYDSDNKYFNSETAALSYIGENTLDIVVMCNVLHEIPPSDWIKTFKEDGLFKCLKEEGYLLIVEDLLIPVGEKPNSDGYFVLSEFELMKLFFVPTRGETFYTEYARDGRLAAILINKKYLSDISDGTVKESIQTLKNRAIEEIGNLRREGNIDYKKGKKLAFWLNQLANCVLYLE